MATTVNRINSSNRKSSSEVTPERANKTSGRGIARIALVVTLCAVALEGFVLAACRVWVTPDSVAYISLGIGLAERMDFQQGLFAFRLPGYPALLAVVFFFFGDASLTAILLVQHAMVVGCALLSVWLAWTLWPNRLFCIIVGVFSVASLHLSGYANAILTEVPYAFLVTLCVLLLARHNARGGIGTLAGASLIAAAATLTKDVGQLMIPICAGAGMARAWRTRSTESIGDAGSTITMRAPSIGHRLLRALKSLPISLVPAFILLLPVLCHNYTMFGKAQLTTNGGMMLYLRAGCLEGLDTQHSEAVATIRSAVERAKAEGRLDPTATHHDYLSVLRACLRIYDADGAIFASPAMADVSELLRRAGMDLIREHPWKVATGTLVDSYRMVMVPDSGYRMQPGAPTTSGRLDPDAILYGVDTYSASVMGLIGGKADDYLAINNEPRATTPFWSAITSWYHRRIERGAPILGLADHPYEEFALLWVLGAALALTLRQRTSWLLINGVVALHVFGAAFCGGVQPRYAVPLQPLLHVLSAVPVALGALGLAAATRNVAGRLFGGRAKTVGQAAPGTGLGVRDVSFE